MISLILAVLILTSCSVTTEPGEEFVMLTNSLTIEAKNLRKEDFWTIQKQIRIKDIQLAIAQYLQDGYQIVDAPTSGTIDLTSLTITGRKALVVWRDQPTGIINIKFSTTCYDSVGKLDSVVVLGVQLDSYNQPENPSFYTNRMQLDIYNEASSLNYSDYENRLIIDYCYFTYNFMQTSGGVGIMNIKIQNSDYDVLAGGVWYQVHNINNKVNKKSSTFTWRAFNDDNIIDNCYIFTDSDPEAGSLTIRGDNPYLTTIKNCYFFKIGNTGGNGLWNQTYTGAKFVISNELIELCKGMFANADSEAVSYIYIRDSILNGGVSYKNVLVPWTGDVNQGQIYSGKDVFDSDELTDDSNNLSLDAIIVQQRNSIRGQIGTIKRTYYAVQFQEDYLMDAALKYFDDNDYLRVRRVQEEAIFVTDKDGPRKIKNLQLYENDGSTLFDYRNDENFLLLAEDSSGNEAWFAWYKGRLKMTVLSDVWKDTEYTITYCLQIWRPPADVSYRNVMPNDDSGLSGNILFQDMTSIFVIP